MTFHHLAVPVICVAVLTAMFVFALRALIVTSWRTPPGRPVPTDTWPYPMRGRGRRGT